MGCTSSSSMDESNSAADSKSRAIDLQLQKDARELDSVIRMLLLGTGESGKSTVMKQMMLLHGGGFSDADRRAYVEVIFLNTLQSLQAILAALLSLDLHISPGNYEAARLIDDVDGESLDDEEEKALVVDAIGRLWADENVKKAMEHRSSFQLNDSAEYFLNNLARTSAPGYQPTNDDMLRARIRTIGIQEHALTIGKSAYRIFDVGGQRSERKKWIHAFEDVSILLFLCAVSEYDQFLFEDETQSRMSEALTVFESIAKSRWFVKSTLVLICNKTDLLRLKLPKSSLRHAFPAYQGDDESYEQATAFLAAQFKSLAPPTKPLYIHFTCATDTNQMATVVNALQDTIARSMMEVVM